MVVPVNFLSPEVCRTRSFGVRYALSTHLINLALLLFGVGCV